MSDDIVPLQQDEVAVVPIEGSNDLVLAIGQDLRERDATPVPRALLEAVIDKGGWIGGASAAKSLLDGSLVRLAPGTVKQLKQGAVFVKDKQGLALGTLRVPGKPGFKSAARILPGAANPVAAALILQTMAIQRNLGQIQKALESVNAKLDLLLEGKHYTVLSQLSADAHQLDELRDKVVGGGELTATDEVKIRDYEDRARAREREATLWLTRLRELLAAQSMPLRAHHQKLEALLEKHVAFWVRTYVVAQLSLAQARTLRLHRASLAEPEAWASQLQDTVQADISRIGYELASLANDLDAYLRRHDIARGLAELSLGKKRTVRRLRRELWRTQEELRLSLNEALPHLPFCDLHPLPELPAPLRRRELEPHPVRDNLGEAQRAAVRGTKQAAEWAGDRILDGTDRVERAIKERRDGIADDAPDEPTDDGEPREG